MKIIQGNCLTELPKLEAGCVHCCVTSPPYWGLRDYKIPATDWPEVEFIPMAGLPPVAVPAMRCVHGLEPDPLSYVAHEVQIFREVRRVLRDDGTLWLNLGDSYAGGGNYRGDSELSAKQASNGGARGMKCGAVPIGPGLKPKDVCGIPWRVAFALQADGWTLRSDVIWHKPNPMPESVTDRPTKAHEYIFLFSKQERYFFDAEAIKEQVNGGAHARKANDANSRMVVERAIGRENSKPNPSRSNIPGVNPKCVPAGQGIKQNEDFAAAVSDLVSSRNKRSVWTVATDPFKGAHFATFPPALIRPCILAGTSARGCCPKCGAPWERMVEGASFKKQDYNGKHSHAGKDTAGRNILGSVKAAREAGGEHDNPFPPKKTVGWQRTCDCSDWWKPLPCTVLDPFLGSGTTAQVALELGRHCIGIELSNEYGKLIEQRTSITPGLALA